MKKEKRGKVILLVPYPAQGHVTPMLKLARALQKEEGLEAVLVTPEFVHRRIVGQTAPEIRCAWIGDVQVEEGRARDFFAIEAAMEKKMPADLERLIGKTVDEDGDEIACVVVDLLASWAICVARNCGLQVAGFWPAMLSAYRLITAIPHMLRARIISESGNPYREAGPMLLPGQPLLSTDDLPWLIGSHASRSSRFKFWRRTLERSATLPWILVNSFPDEFVDDDEMTMSKRKLGRDHQLRTNRKDDHQNSPRIIAVGAWINGGSSGSRRGEAGGSFWAEDMSCLAWLELQRAGSVVYVSFGSWVGPIGEGKVRSLAVALEASGRPFIWVVGGSWRQGLPAGYLERVSASKQGKLVSWAPQMQVLQHRAVGCFLTHCGWNSTLEAIRCRKPLLCYPVAGDQFLNCAYIVNIWRIGVRMGGFGMRDVEESLKRVMDVDSSREMRHALLTLNEKMVGKEASSRAMANLEAFVFVISNSHH